MNVKVDLNKLSKEQIIALVETGALTTETKPHHPKAVEQATKPHQPKMVGQATKQQGQHKTSRATKKQIGEKLAIIRSELAKGRSLTTTDLKSLGIGGNIKSLIHNHLKPSRWARVVKKGKNIIILPTERTVPPSQKGRVKATKPIVVFPKIGRKKGKVTDYNKFVGKRISELCRQGMRQQEAFKIAKSEWSEHKKRGASSFPSFESIKSDFSPILKGILRRCVLEDQQIDFKGVNYALDIRTEADYRRFVDDVLANTQQIIGYFKTEGRFKFDGYRIKFERSK